MSKTVFAISVLLAIAMVGMAKDRVVDYTQVPSTARQSLEQFFKVENVSIVMLDDGKLGAEYEVHYQDGSKAVSDSNGKLIEIKCVTTPVPDVFIPQPILQNVHSRFSLHYIQKYEAKRYEYEVTLSNGLEITYDLKFNLIEVEDD